MFWCFYDKQKWVTGKNTTSHSAISDILDHKIDVIVVQIWEILPYHSDFEKTTTAVEPFICILLLFKLPFLFYVRLIACLQFLSRDLNKLLTLFQKVFYDKECKALFFFLGMLYKHNILKNPAQCQKFCYKLILKT